MRRRAFTLAEVLVTLGIIGVVAALTIPSLNANVAQQKIGPALAKAINTLENANATILAKNQESRLDQVSGGYFNALKSQLNGAAESAPSPKFNQFDNSSTLTLSGTYDVITTKDGVSYYIKNTTDTKAQSASSKYVGKYYTCAIDINGRKAKPNSLAKDIFEVYIDASGSVIPMGGYEFDKYNGIAWSSYGGARWKQHCNGKVYVSSNPEPGSGSRSCAGAVVDNGYKAKYNGFYKASVNPGDVGSSSSSGSGYWGYGYGH